ncbi:HNH endonuclease family protein [uncultured Amnibacterium sp.]|uniref:HNH endonuclease family protein n=1 Tax=uncultured Amnibacterium sp. TaxID=1631851 RepID=UPI0035C9F61F
MKRPLAVLTTAALAGLLVLAPGLAAHADSGATSEIENASASWRDNTLTAQYDWDAIGSADEDTYPASGKFETLVDGVVVDTVNAGAYDSDSDYVVRVPRAKSAGPAAVSIAVTSCALDSTFTALPCMTSTDFTKTVTQVLTPPTGKSSALALLGKLKVKAESHSSSYKRTKFELWIDANGDHENTRAEVLKSESKTKVTENTRHTVKKGTWTSPYDGTATTVASKLDIDHLVPVEEAWTSGAYGWSAKEREANANDLGYGASLTAVTTHANRSKGDREPNAYLPTLTSYRCTYVRNWIAVKYRWKLAVNTAEKSALTTDIATYCASNDWVKTPGTPNVKALVPKPKPKPKLPAGGSGSGSGSGSFANATASPVWSSLKHGRSYTEQRAQPPAIK